MVMAELKLLHPEWVDVPYQVKRTSVRDACRAMSNVKQLNRELAAARAKGQRLDEPFAQLRFRSRKNPRQSCYIPDDAVTEHGIYHTVVKMVDFSYKTIVSLSLKTRSEPRRRPNSSRRLRLGISPRNTELIPAQATPRGETQRDSLNRIGSAYTLPQPVLRCKRRSHAAPSIAPQYVHMCFTRFLAGTVKATWTPLPTGTLPSAWDALRKTERTTGQYQGSCLMDTEPVTLHELHPTDHRTVGRVHLVYLNSPTTATGQEVGPAP